MVSTKHAHNHTHHGRERFLEICLLVLLNGEPTHGYRLLELLGQFGYQQDEMDVSTLYRTLRRMEENGLVESAWEDSDQGPNRRKYCIIEAGKTTLEARIEHMKRRMEHMQSVIEYYSKNAGLLDER